MSETIHEFPPIEWDADGYPTEDSLDALETANRNSFGIEEAARYLRQELAKCAENCVASYEEQPATDIVDRPCLHLHFSTGGWSGAEDLIAALMTKFWIAHIHLQWRRGGHYIFEVPA